MANRADSAASDVQWCGDDQPHEAHPWSDVVCPGRVAAPARQKLDREGARILIAIQEDRMQTNAAGRYTIDGEERPDKRTRELLRSRGLIESHWNRERRRFDLTVTPKGAATLKRDLHEIAEAVRDAAS